MAAVSLSLQHHIQTQDPGGAGPGLGGVPGPAAGGLSGALRGGVALGPRRQRPTPGHRRGARGHRRLQGGLQLSQQVRTAPTRAR